MTVLKNITKLEITCDHRVKFNTNPVQKMTNLRWLFLDLVEIKFDVYLAENVRGERPENAEDIEEFGRV